MLHVLAVVLYEGRRLHSFFGECVVWQAHLLLGPGRALVTGGTHRACSMLYKSLFC